MKHIMPAAALLLFAEAPGQNLVPNWSFEEYTECPTNLAQIDYAVGWQWIGGSPDLYSSCSLSDTVNVPSNFGGYQPAHSGNGYAGVVTYHADVREYIQTQLNTPLTPGLRTYLSMYVSPGGFASLGQISPQLMSSGIGLRMSVTPFPIPDDWIQYDLNSALIYMSSILDDTSAWTHLYGEFIPDSAYEYVQIANFFEEDSTLAITIANTGGGPYAYAFVDDVCVSQTEGGCSGVNAIAQGKAMSVATTAWLDADANLLVDWSKGRSASAKIRILDVTGRSLAEIAVSDPVGRTSHALPSFANGPCLAQIESVEHPTCTFRLIRAGR